MKAYLDYMDGIQVSPELHGKIVERVFAPKRRPIRLGAALAGVAGVLFLTLLLVAIDFGPHPGPGPNLGPWLHQDEVRLRGGTLRFAPTEAVPQQSKKILGYFREDLSPDTVAGIFGGSHPVPQGFGLETAVGGYGHTGELADIHLSYSDGQEEIGLFIGWDYISQAPAVSTIHGLEVKAGHWPRQGDFIYWAGFELNGITCYLESASQRLLAETVDLVLGGGMDTAGVAPKVLPEFRYDRLTLEQARRDPDFGSFVPGTPPQGFAFSSAIRYLDQSSDQLLVSFQAGMRYVELSIARKSPNIQARIVDVLEPETYDLGLYPIPRADSVPEELRDKVTRPVFLWQDISIDVLRARAYRAQEAGDDSSGYRMEFSILKGEIVLDCKVKGSTPEAVLEMLQSIEGLK